MSSQNNDLGIEIFKASIRGIKAITQREWLGILALSVCSKLVGVPPLIVPIAYAIIKGYFTKPVKFEGYAITGSKIEGDQIIYTLNTYVPLDQVQADKSKLEHYWNTDIVRFKQHGTDKRTVFVVTQKGLKNSKEYRILDALSDFNPEPLEPKENDFYVTYRYKLSCDFKTLTNSIKLLQNYLGAQVVLSYPYISVKYRKPEILITLPDFINRAKEGFLVGINTYTGEPFYMTWDQAVHLLAAGKTGSGKSVLAHALIDSAMYYNADMSWLMYDGKYVELSRYKDFSNVQYTNSIEEFAKLLDKVMEIMKARYLDMDKQGITDYKGKKLIVCIDEIAVIRNTLGEKNDTLSPKLIRLLNEGRAAGIHLMMFTQRPQVKQMDTNLRESVPSYIGLFMSAKDAKQFMEIDGLESLTQGNCKVKNFKLKDLANVQICFSKEDQHNQVFKHIEAHYTNKISLAKIPGGARKLRPVTPETISIIEYFEDKTGMQYKLVRNIVDQFVESLAGLTEMPRTSDHEAALGLTGQPRKLRELKEWATRQEILGKINKTKYSINQRKVKEYLAKQG